MSDLILTKTKMHAGVWEGVVTGASSMPRLSVTHLNKEIPDLTVVESKEEGMWLVKIPIPAIVIADGMQTLVITDKETGQKLGSVALLAGGALDDDMRAEIDLLRAELDMLKRSFRRHCNATT